MEHKKTKRGYYEKQLTTNVILENGAKKRVTGLSKVSYEDACKDAINKKQEIERLYKISILESKTSTNDVFKNYILMFMEYKHKKVPTKRRWTSSTYESNMSVYNSKYANSKLGNTQLKNLNVKLFQDFYDNMTLKNGLDVKYVRNIKLLAEQTFDYINRNIVAIENYALLCDLNEEWVDEVGLDYAEDVDEDDIQILTDDEIMRLYNTVKEEPTHFRYAFCQLLQLATGCRIQEINAITLNCIDFEKKEILVNKALGVRKDKKGKKETYMKTTKNKVVRKIFMDDNIEYLLQCIIKYMPRGLVGDYRKDLIEQGLLVYSTKGELVDVDTYTGEFKRLCNYCDISIQYGVGARILRHTWDSYNNIKNNNPLQILITSKAAGHTPQIDINSYTHISDDIMRENIKNPITHIQQEQKEDEKLYKELLQFKKWKANQGS